MKLLAVCTVCFLLQLSVFGQRSTASIESSTVYKQLSGKPLTSKYGNVASVKVIVETKTKKIHYINTTYYQYHYEFATSQLHIYPDLSSFNELNYGSSSRRDFLLANLNCNEADGTYFLDLSVFDLMPAERIIELVKQVKATTFFGDKLVFLLNTDRLMAIRSQLDQSIRTVTPADIYARVNYQAISEGKTQGMLRFESSLDSLKTPLLPSDIVITTKTPEFLPLVRGILLTTLQTPLSHLVILGRNRSIPIGVYTKLFSDPNLRALDRQWVELTVYSDTFTLKKTDFHPAPATVSAPVHLRRNLLTDSLIGAAYLGPADAGTVGNKAANFGLLKKLSGAGKYKTPEAAFAIPFYWYEIHMRQSGALELLEQLVANPPKDQPALEKALKAIRDCIRKTPVDSLLLARLKNRLGSSGYTTFRFRSSTNAEDAAGFSGAGLYDSKTVDLNDPAKTAELALQKVWASLWSSQAWLERSYFGIDQREVSMGILVHRSFPSEAANGVAITKNIYRLSYHGFVINVQKGDISVVAPDPGIICDQIVLYPANELSGFQRTIEVITTSSLNEGKLIMTKAELEHLQAELERIKLYYWKHVHKRKPGEAYDDFGLDLEFKLDEGTRELYIKQVREYNN